MTQAFYPLSPEQLFCAVFKEIEKGSVFGISKKLFFNPDINDFFKIERYGMQIHSPFGPAAGPHTQLAQNIVVSWLCGARFIELKTVQTLDNLDVSKPCIDMEDEGYNCEWSQELSLDQSFDQYLAAWIVIHALHHYLGFKENVGTIFNMSVGYDLNGILNVNMQHFLDKMHSCRQEKQRIIEKISRTFSWIRNIEIPDTISNSVTLSTMHGCPPDEIEKIAKYLIEEKNLHTTVKLNPTLLGSTTLREILNIKLAYDIEVPDLAFEHDLKYNDAKVIIQNLSTIAAQKQLFFGIKLTNTLECINKREILPSSEKMNYMSGRALHPLAIKLAEIIRNDFPQLPISFSAGVDSTNIAQVFGCNLVPATICTDLLKPGGYLRFISCVEQLRKTGKHIVDLGNYCETVLNDVRYKKAYFPDKSVKTNRNLPQFDCIKAPCTETCPSEQDVPEYMKLCVDGRFDDALSVILRHNPFPKVTGNVCDHLCMTKCTRINIDEPLRIRDIKRFIAENGLSETKVLSEYIPQKKNKKFSVAIIGAGPAGLSCAYYCALDCFDTTVFEAKGYPGGMVHDAIPRFRLFEKDLLSDVENIKKLGVSIRYNNKIDAKFYSELKQKYDFIFVAVGAQKSKKMNIPGNELMLDALFFLENFNNNNEQNIGKNIAVIGGGNSAMDAARSALRCAGDGGKVTIIYRRTINEMPADKEELAAVIEEGIELRELTDPVMVKKESSIIMTLRQMKLGEKDSSGRKRPIPVSGSEYGENFDTIITAIGQDRDADFMDKDEAESIFSENCGETKKTTRILSGGDALRGPLNIITAIADGRKAAEHFMKIADCNWTIDFEKERKNELLEQHQKMFISRSASQKPKELKLNARTATAQVISSFTRNQAEIEAARCLFCSERCDICVSVCPNRANISFVINPPLEYLIHKANIVKGTVRLEKIAPLTLKQKYQVLNIADFCNECGNCATFCPTAGAPYKNKPRISLSEASFASRSKGYLFVKEKDCSTLVFKDGSKKESLIMVNNRFVYETEDIVARADLANGNIVDIYVKSLKLTKTIDFTHAAEMSVLVKALEKTI